MEKNYTAVITQRTPRPRSKRLREMGIGSVAGATVVMGISDSNAGAAYLPIAVFGDMFSKVVIKEAVAEETDDDGNVITPAQPAVYGIRANYDFFSVKNISAFGFSASEGSGSGGSVNVTQILNEGVHIATINGVEIYAPEGGSGSSSWAELTGKPSWLTDTKPSVSAFANDAGYVKSSSLGSLATLSSVSTENITNHAVTEDKIARGAVTAYQLADAAVQTAKIADVAVTTAKIADGAVTAGKIAAGAIENSKLQHSSMTLWGAEVALGASYDGNILLGTNSGLRLTDGTHTAWLKYDSANNAVYVTGADGAQVNLYSTGSVSAYGFSESSGGGGSVDVTQILSSGVHIATIAGVEIYAPKGGASAWADITGKPAWLETKPSVSAFDNDAGYVTSSSLYWSRNSNGEVYTDYNVVTESLTVNGGLAVNDSFTFNASGQFNDDVGISGMLECDSTAYFRGEVYIGDITDKSVKYLWFAYRGIFFEGEGSTSGNPWYGTLCTHDAYTQKSINLRCFNPYTVIPKLAVGSGYLDGTTVPSYTLSVIGQSYVNGSSIVDGYAKVSSYVETSTAYAATYVLKPFANSGSQDGSGNIVTPSWKSRIEMYDEGNGIIILDVNSEEYLRLAASNGYIQARKDIKLDDDKALRIGSAYLRWDSTNNALYVTGKDGAQINFYATGNVAGFSGLDGSVSELANLDITGQLTAARVNIGANSSLYEDSSGQLKLDIAKGLYVGGVATRFNSDGWLYLTSQNEIQLTDGAILRIGSTAANHGITDVYADGTYVYITINGKRYRFTPSSTTTV